MYRTPRHRVFISFHHQDQAYKDWFVQIMGSDIVDESVGDGDIDDDNLATDTIRQRIRDNFIRDATVTVVLNRSLYVAAKACGLGDRFQPAGYHEESPMRSVGRPAPEPSELFRNAM